MSDDDGDLEEMYFTDWEINMGMHEELKLDLDDLEEKPEKDLPSYEEYEAMLLTVEHRPTIPVLMSLSDYDLMLVGKRKGS